MAENANMKAEAAISFEGYKMSEITSFIEEFISGTDCSIERANEIEVALDDFFPDDDYAQRAVEMLAMYRPDGGEFLFDTAAIVQQLTGILRHLSGGNNNMEAADRICVSAPCHRPLRVTGRYRGVAGSGATTGAPDAGLLPEARGGSHPAAACVDERQR